MLTLIGNSGMQRLLGATPVSASPASVHRCSPERPDCDCAPEKKSAAQREALAPTGGTWMAPGVSRFACGVREDAERRGVPTPGQHGAAQRPACGVQEESEEAAGAAREAAPAGPSPRQGAATIVCDGKGGYGVALNSWAGATCGIEGCVTRHEKSHAKDWKKRWPEGCKGKKAGDTIPLGGAGYDAFLKASECRAYKVEIACIKPKILFAKKACKQTLKDHLADTKNQKKSFC